MLVEATTIAGGSTAGGLGIVAPEPDAWFRLVEPEAGRLASRTAWNEAQKGAGDFARAIRKLDIKCDLTEAPYFINAESPEGATAVKKEMAVRRAANVPASWATPQAMRAETHLDTAGALKLSAGFTCDPVRAALGLVSAAEKHGARVFEQSAVRRTTFTRKYADVVLKDATIRTTGIVVATGEPGTVFSQLRRHVRRATGYVVVTEPLSAAMRRESGKRSAIVTEAADENRHWLRWLTDDRMLFAGGLSPLLSARLRDTLLKQHTAELMYQLSVRYPAISGLPARWAWDTEVVTAVDGLPWIGPHRNYPFHFFSMAFGWHGDSLAWPAARAALRYFKGEATREDAALGFARHLG
jgi:glycine/D-amino acid oxidase-like deaminating enzyme